VALLRKNKPDKDGIVLVEMALLLPLLLLVTLGAIEYGWMFLKSQQLANAAREGARIGATPDATNAEVMASVNSVMTAANMDTSGYAVNISPAAGGLPSGNNLSVTVTVAYANIDLMGVPLIPVPANLSASTSMNKEGP